MRYFCVVVACAVSLLAGGCSGINDPSKNTVRDFSDTLEQNAGDVWEFDVTTSNGEYSVTLTALSPDPSTGLSIYLGQVGNGLCIDSLGQKGIARLSAIPVLSGPIEKGHYCIQVFDLGAIPRTQTYTLRVSHP